MNELVQYVADDIIRHVLSIIAGTLVTSGALAAGDKTDFVRIGSGVVIGLGTMAWGAVNKLNTHRTIRNLKESATNGQHSD